MIKQWSLKSVFESHGYDQISEGNFHDIFARWLKFQFNETKIKIIDIGGGNGRVCLNILPNIDEYLCLDLNYENIKTGSEYFKENKNIKFELLDVDNEQIDYVCDVVYIDSVLTMLEEPFNVLIKLKKSCDFIFINRVEFKNKTEKLKYLWGGMTEESTLWNFDELKFKEFCIENNYELLILTNNSFVLKNNK